MQQKGQEGRDRIVSVYIKKVNSDIQNTVRIRLVNIGGLLEIGLNEVAEMNQDSLHNI